MLVFGIDLHRQFSSTSQLFHHFLHCCGAGQKPLSSPQCGITHGLRARMCPASYPPAPVTQLSLGESSLVVAPCGSGTARCCFMQCKHRIVGRTDRQQRIFGQLEHPAVPRFADIGQLRACHALFRTAHRNAHAFREARGIQQFSMIQNAIKDDAWNHRLSGSFG